MSFSVVQRAMHIYKKRIQRIVWEISVGQTKKWPIHPQSTGFEFSHMLYLETVDLKKKSLSIITLHVERRYIFFGEKNAILPTRLLKKKNYIFLSMGPS